jgi:hypothetical protein
MAEGTAGGDGLIEAVAGSQAAFYALTGFWPVFTIRTFEWITGPKADRWLVKATGLLIGVIGLVVGLSARRRRITPEIAVLGAGSALSLGGIDLFYVRRGRLRWVYALDGLGELALAAAWALAWQRRLRSSGAGKE